MSLSPDPTRFISDSVASPTSPESPDVGPLPPITVSKRGTRPALAINVSTPSSKLATEPRAASGSVKQLVAWIEEGKRSATNTPSSFKTQAKPKGPSPAQLDYNPDEHENSLTFLRYERYFSDRPLQRCLDRELKAAAIKNNLNKNTATQPSRLRPQNNYDDNDSSMKSVPTPSSSNGERKRLHSLPVTNCSEQSTRPAEYEEEYKKLVRAKTNPEDHFMESMKFWNGVRGYLRVYDDDEHEIGPSKTPPLPTSAPDGRDYVDDSSDNSQITVILSPETVVANMSGANEAQLPKANTTSGIKRKIFSTIKRKPVPAVPRAHTAVAEGADDAFIDDAFIDEADEQLPKDNMRPFNAPFIASSETDDEICSRYYTEPEA